MYVQGRYSYQGNDGVEYTVTYTADKNGFQPVITTNNGGNFIQQRIGTPVLDSLTG